MPVADPQKNLAFSASVPHACLRETVVRAIRTRVQYLSLAPDPAWWRVAPELPLERARTHAEALFWQPTIDYLKAQNRAS